MSRGLGKVQRSLMDLLSRGDDLTSFDLAAQIYGVITRPDGRCTVSSVQRAGEPAAAQSHFPVRAYLSGLSGLDDTRAG